MVGRIARIVAQFLQDAGRELDDDAILSSIPSCSSPAISYETSGGARSYGLTGAVADCVGFCFSR